MVRHAPAVSKLRRCCYTPVMRFEKWGVTSVIAIALCAMCVVVLMLTPSLEENLRRMLRVTARTSLFFLLVAFGARPLRQLWQSKWSAWLLRNRRYIGNGLTVSHGLHLLAIVALPLHADVVYETGTLVGGGGLLALIFALAVTSSDAAQRALGRGWKALHLGGSWLLLVAFMLTFAPEPGGDIELRHLYGVGGSLLVVMLRIAAAWKTRRTRVAA